MTEYPDSECDAHRNVKTSSPVCVVCMHEDIERLRQLGQAVLKTRIAEAKALMTLENAMANYSDYRAERAAYERAAIAAGEAEKALSNELTPNVRIEGRSACAESLSNDLLAGNAEAKKGNEP